MLPEIISKFQERYPYVNLELHQGTSKQIAALGRENSVDFAIATESIEFLPEFNLLPGFQRDRVVLSPQDHPLEALEDALTLETLAEHTLVTHVFSSNRE